MLSRWPRLRRLVKWTAGTLLLIAVLLVGVYLLRDKLLARPLANLVAEQMSAALGGKFTLERVEGDYFTELVLVGLRTETEPPEGPLRRIDVDRATVRFSLRQLLDDPIAAVRAIEVNGLVLHADLDRPSPPSEKPIDLADVLPKTFPQLDLDGTIRIRAGGRDYRVEHLAVEGSGSVLDIQFEGLDLAGELRSPLLRLQVEHSEFGTFVIRSDDALAGVIPRRISATILGDLHAEAELDVATGTIRATFTEQKATLTAADIAVAKLPAELIRRLPSDTQLPTDGVVDFTATVLRPLADDLAVRATVTVNRLQWDDWTIDALEIRGAWSDGIARLESMDVRFDRGFVRAREIMLRPELKLPLVRLDHLEADLPDLRIPLRRLGLVAYLPDEPITFKVRAHRAPGEPVKIESLTLTAGSSHVQATGEFTLPTDVDHWEQTPIALEIDAVIDARSLPPLDVPVEGSITVKGQLTGTPGDPKARLEIEGHGLTVDGQPIDTLEAKGTLDGPRVDLESLSFVAAPGTLVVKGRADLEHRSLENGSYTVDISNLGELAKLIPGAPAMKGVIRGSGRIIRASIEGEREGDAELVCEGIEIKGVVIDSAVLKAQLRGDTLTLPEFSVRAPDWSVAGSADATISFDSGAVAASVKTLKAQALGRSLELRAPLRLDWDGKTAIIRDLDATVLDGRIRGSATYGETLSVDLEATGIDSARIHEEAQGLLGFKLDAAGTVAAPRWKLSIASSGLTIRQQKAKVDVRLRQDDRGIQIDALQVDGVPNLSLNGSGFVPIEVGRDGVRRLGGEPSLQMSVTLTPDGLAPYLPQAMQFSRATFETTLRGNTIDGTFRVRDLRWTKAPDDFIAEETVLELTGRADGIDVILEGPEFGPLMAQARLHSDAGIDWKHPTTLIDRVLSAALNGTASFAIPNLKPFTKLPGSPIAHGDGAAKIEITLAGTPRKPRVNTIVTVKSPHMRLRGDIPTMQDVDARIRVTEKGLWIERFDAKLGYAPFAVRGHVTFPETPGAQPIVDLQVDGKNVLLSRTPYLRLRADLDLALKGPVEALAATGAVTITNVLWSEPLKLLSNGGAAAADKKLHLFSIRDEPLRNMVFDVDIRANETIRLDNNVIRGRVSANLKLYGTGGVPKLGGRVDFRDLYFTFPITRERLKITRGSLVFPNDDPFRPVVNASGEARKLGHELIVEVTGKVPDVEIHITSIPALPRDEAIVLLTTGTTKERLEKSGEMTAGIYVGRSILDIVMGPSDPDKESWIERFEFESGKDVSAAGDPTMEARFRLTKRWYIRAERDRWDDYNGGFLLRLRFR